MIGSSGWATLASALRHREHRLFNYTLTPIVISVWAQRTGVGWLAWELTGSPAWLGVIAASDLLPAVILAPFSGVLADRVPAHILMRVAHSVNMIQALLLWTATVTGIIDIWLLFGLTLISGLNQPFATSARMVYYPTLVPKSDLGTAIAINSTLYNLGRILGPAIAGLTIGPFGVTVLFFGNFVAFLAHVLNISRLRGQYGERVKRIPKSVFGEIGEGLRYAARHQGIGPILVLLMISSISSRPVSEIMPGIADEVFGKGPEGLGWLLAAIGAGGTLGAMWLAQRGAVKGLTSVVVMLTIILSASIVGFALIGNYYAALGFAAVLGFGMVVTGIAIQSLMQMAVEPELRGRVMSIYTLAWRGLPAVGAIMIGAAAEFVGLPWAVTGAGAVCGLCGLWALSIRRRMAAALEVEPRN